MEVVDFDQVIVAIGGEISRLGPILVLDQLLAVVERFLKTSLHGMRFVLRCNYFIFTVKPVLNSHTREAQKVAA